ncbi:MAG: T9SS type A sorting domain-containing protein [Bacteroidota bacterium]|nr:T9SS type A sorting domain-containing protein [Bacteroidota bacterium]
MKLTIGIIFLIIFTNKIIAQQTLGCVPANLSNQTVCQNSVLSFQASVKQGISGYSWTVSKLIGGEVVASSNSASFTVSGFPTANELYLIICTADSLGSPVSRNFGYIPINPTPVVNLGSDRIQCPNFKVILNSPTSPTGSGYKYEWKLLPNSTLVGNTSITVTGAGSYQLKVTDNSTGCNGSDLIEIIPKNKPDITAISTSGFPVRCPNKSLGLDVRINTQTETPYTYQWTPNFAISNTSAKNPVVTNSIPQTYQAIITDVNNCKDTSTIYIGLNPALSVQTIFKDSAECSQNTIKAKILTTGGTQYIGLNKYRFSWTPNIGITDSTLAEPLITPQLTGILYKVTVIDSNNCTAIDSVRIRMKNGPQYNFFNLTNPICIGQSTTVIPIGPEPKIFSTGRNTITPLYSGVYTIIGTNTNTGCNNKLLVNITVNGLPTVSGIASPTKVCYGTEAKLIGSGANTYIWSNGVTNASFFIPTTTGTSSNGVRVNFYTVTGIDNNGCTNQSIVALSISGPYAMTLDYPLMIVCTTVTGPQSIVLYGNIIQNTSSTTLSGYVINNQGQFVLPTTQPALYNNLSYSYKMDEVCTLTKSFGIMVEDCSKLSNTVEKNSEIELMIYPNPNTGSFVIQSGKPCSIRLVGLLGNEIINDKSNGIFHVNNLMSGLYFAEIIFEDKLHKTIRIIVN